MDTDPVYMWGGVGFACLAILLVTIGGFLSFHIYRFGTVPVWLLFCRFARALGTWHLAFGIRHVHVINGLPLFVLKYWLLQIETLAPHGELLTPTPNCWHARPNAKIMSQVR